MKLPWVKRSVHDTIVRDLVAILARRWQQIHALEDKLEVAQRSVGVYDLKERIEDLTRHRSMALAEVSRLRELIRTGVSKENRLKAQLSATRKQLAQVRKDRSE